MVPMNRNHSADDIIDNMTTTDNTNTEKKPVIHNAGIGLMGWTYMHLVKPYVFHTEPDKLHEQMVSFCKSAEKIPGLMGLLHLFTEVESGSLERDIMGLHFMNPFGLSAGLDKTGNLTTCLDSAGWGFETVGTMTGTYSKGNPRPWYHRLPEQTALMVHAGLPSEGAEIVAKRASSAKRKHGMLLFGSVGPSNKQYENQLDGMIDDYLKAFDVINADNGFNGIEINISCPNLQFGEPFTDAHNVNTLMDEIARRQINKPVMVKCPSFMNANELIPILDVLAAHAFINGVSVCNLRRDRTGLQIPDDWLGNISGLPTQECNENAIRLVRKNYDDRFVINGIGGTITPDDALRKLDEGADLVSGITAFMYRGPQMMAEWKRALIRREQK